MQRSRGGRITARGCSRRRRPAIDMVQHPISLRASISVFGSGGTSVAVTAMSICTVPANWCADRNDVTERSNWRHGAIESPSPDIITQKTKSNQNQNSGPMTPPACSATKPRAVSDCPPGATGRRCHVDGRRRVVRQIVREERDPALIGRESLVKEISLWIRRDHPDTRIAIFVRA